MSCPVRGDFYSSWVIFLLGTLVDGGGLGIKDLQVVTVVTVIDLPDVLDPPEANQTMHSS